MPFMCVRTVISMYPIVTALMSIIMRVEIIMFTTIITTSTNVTTTTTIPVVLSVLMIIFRLVGVSVAFLIVSRPLHVQPGVSVVKIH